MHLGIRINSANKPELRLCWASENRGITIVAMAAGAMLWLAASPVLAAMDDTGSIEWARMGIQLFGGLALFLFGMEQMGSALRIVAGDRMRAILGALTNNRVFGLLTGLTVTAIIQSSSVTTVMLVGFVAAGLMSLSQSIGVILGADIGTTVTAQVIAFKVTKYALLLVGIGFIPMFIANRERTRQYGVLVMGLGMIFLGLGIMSTGMKPLRSYEPFIQLMQDVADPLVGVLVGTAFTALIQSSSAAMGVIIALASQGLISLEAGITLALGANIGTCITAGLAAIGKPREAVRVAVAHVTFKVLGVLMIIWFIPQFADAIRSISPVEEGVTGIDKLAAETPRQIANAHTVFNVAIALLFLPFTTQFARFCEWVVPDRPIQDERGAILQSKYLDNALLAAPPLALERTRREIGRIGRRLRVMFDRILPAVINGNRQDLQDVVDMDEEVDALHGHIVLFLGRLSQTKLERKHAGELMNLMQSANLLEQAGDIIQNNIKTVGIRRIDENITVSDATSAIIEQYHQRVAEALDDTVKAVANDDLEAAARVRAMRDGLSDLAKETAQHELERLVADEPNRLKTYIREMELLEHMDTIFTLCRRICGMMLPADPTQDADADEQPQPVAN